jgi:hypothetical protein
MRSMASIAINVGAGPSSRWPRTERERAQYLLDEFVFELVFRWSGGRADIIIQASALREAFEDLLDQVLPE